MRIRYRLVLIIAIAALLPLLVTGWVTAGVADRNMLSLSQEVQLLQAKELSTLTETWMRDRIQGLRAQVSLWDIEARTPAAREGLLVVTYGQYEAVNVVALLTADGEPMAGPVYQEHPDPLGEWAAHEGVSPARAAQLLERAPWAAAAATGTAVGQPYRPAGARAVVVPVAVSAGGGRGGAVLVAELSLAWLGDRFAEHRVEGQAVALLDGSGEVLVGAASEMLDPSSFGSFDGNLEGELTTTLEDGTDVLQTFDSVADLGWDVVVAAPLASTRAAGLEIRAAMYYFYGLAVLLTAVVGLMGASQLARPVVALKDAALAVAEGELGRRVAPGGSLELSELGKAFNFMSRRLKQNREELARQAGEIEAFNRELQERVYERTRELTEAQARLVESSRLAAVAHMGAGLAHELNNPVAGILGMTQLALARSGDGELGPALRSIEAQAQRCREILATLNKLTGDGPGVRQALELHTLVDSVLELTGGSMAERGVAVEHRRSAPLHTTGDPVRLGQAFSQLIRSLSLKLESGGALIISGAVSPNGVELQLTLSGPQRETRDDWLASGMGFWIAHQIVGQHQGWLEEAEEEGGSSYRVFLPVA